MAHKFHFISGLPRSGSTLLSALLRQNPSVHAHMSGPVGGIVGNLMDSMAASNEFSVFISDAQRSRILRGVFDSYYGDEYPEVIFDTNRGWCARMPLLQMLHPGSKVIACVRDTSWILDSIERLHRRNPALPSSLFNHQSGGTVYSRIDGVAGPNGMLGFAYNALKEAFYGNHAKHLLVVQYDTLTAEPQRVFDAIYAFIGLPAFQHDFENARFDAAEFDRKAGTPGLHTVHSTVTQNIRDPILPPDIFNRFINDAFWKNPAANPHGVTVV